MRSPERAAAQVADSLGPGYSSCTLAVSGSSFFSTRNVWERKALSAFTVAAASTTRQCTVVWMSLPVWRPPVLCHGTQCHASCTSTRMGVDVTRVG